MNLENLKTLKHYIIFEKKIGRSIVCNKCGYEYKKIFKEKESIEILKILGLNTNVEEYQKIYNHV